jgi:hypothetical protein
MRGDDKGYQYLPQAATSLMGMGGHGHGINRILIVGPGERTDNE